MRISILISCIFVIAFTGCNQNKLGQAPLPENYQEELEAWKADRLESLTNPTGWMRLAGMYWLEEGKNSFGSNRNADIKFPEGTIPDIAGTITKKDSLVTMQVADGVAITHSEEPVRELTIYDGGEAPHLEYGSLEWLVIEREDMMGIRLYNKENEKVDQFKGFDTYPVNAEWHVKARLIPHPKETTIPVINVLGQNTETPSPGILEFIVDGEIHTLAALEGSTRMFVILGDLTNKTETYQAGRYLYIDYPEEGSDYTVIDFNKAYNPPCAFSTFTTCQLPPAQNQLDIAVTAGERRAVGWAGL